MPSNYSDHYKLALQARNLFTDRACEVLPVIGKAISDRLTELVNKPGSARDMQYHRDAQLAFQAGGASWRTGLLSVWRTPDSTASSSGSAQFGLETTRFELVNNDVMDDQILASRLALRLLDFA